MNLIIATLLICNVGGPGTTRQAQPTVDKFLRRLEKVGGWKAHEVAGTYLTRLAACDRYVAEKKPSMIVTDLVTYLERQAQWKLVPLAHMGQAEATRYHVLVPEGSAKKLGDLKGKVFVTTLAKHPKFLSKIVFGGKLDVTSYFGLKRTRRPLKGLRKVARGQAAATLVDDLAYKFLGELKLPKKLVSIYASKRLPGLTLSSVGKDAGLKKRVLASLSKLCKGPGAALCKTFRVHTFAPAKMAIYRRLTKQYR